MVNDEMEFMLLSLKDHAEYFLIKDAIMTLAFKDAKEWAKKLEKSDSNFNTSDITQKYEQTKFIKQKELEKVLTEMQLEQRKMVIIPLLTNGKDSFMHVLKRILNREVIPDYARVLEKGFSRMSLANKHFCLEYFVREGSLSSYRFIKGIQQSPTYADGNIKKMIEESLKSIRKSNRLLEYFESVLEDDIVIELPAELDEINSIEIFEELYNLADKVRIYLYLKVNEDVLYTIITERLLERFRTQYSIPPKKNAVEDALLLATSSKDISEDQFTKVIKAVLAAPEEQKEFIIQFMNEKGKNMLIHMALDGTDIQKKWILSVFLRKVLIICEVSTEKITKMVTTENIVIATLASALLIKNAGNNERERYQAVIEGYISLPLESDFYDEILTEYVESKAHKAVNLMTYVEDWKKEKLIKFLLASEYRDFYSLKIVNELNTQDQAVEEVLKSEANSGNRNIDLLTALATKLVLNYDKASIDGLLRWAPWMNEHIGSALVDHFEDHKRIEEIDWLHPKMVEKINKLSRNLKEHLHSQLERANLTAESESKTFESYKEDPVIMMAMIENVKNSLSMVMRIRNIIEKEVAKILCGFKEGSHRFIHKAEEIASSLQMDKDQTSSLESFIHEFKRKLKRLDLDWYLESIFGIIETEPNYDYDKLIEQYKILRIEKELLKDKRINLYEDFLLYAFRIIGHTVEKMQVLMQDDVQFASLTLEWIESIGLIPIHHEISTVVIYSASIHDASPSISENQIVSPLTCGIKTRKGTVILKSKVKLVGGCRDGLVRY